MRARRPPTCGRTSSGRSRRAQIPRANARATVSELREKLSRLDPDGDDTEDYWQDGEAYGSAVSGAWWPGSEQGALDVVLDARENVARAEGDVVTRAAGASIASSTS